MVERRSAWNANLLNWQRRGARFSYGESEDFAYNPAKDPVHDFQVTVLHLLGIDHERLTHKFQCRHFRLTDVYGRVVNEILASLRIRRIGILQIWLVRPDSMR